MGAAIALRLKQQRERANLSKNALAQAAGISVQAVAFIEDAVNSPSVSTLIRLCDALKISPTAILGEALEGEQAGWSESV